MNIQSNIKDLERALRDAEYYAAHLKCCIDELLTFDLKDGYAIFKIKVG